MKCGGNPDFWLCGFTVHLLSSVLGQKAPEHYY